MAASAKAKVVVRFPYLFSWKRAWMKEFPEGIGGRNATWSGLVSPPTVRRIVLFVDEMRRWLNLSVQVLLMRLYAVEFEKAITLPMCGDKSQMGLYWKIGIPSIILAKTKFVAKAFSQMG